MDKNFTRLIDTFLSDIRDHFDDPKGTIVNEKELESFVDTCWESYGPTLLVKKVLEGKNDAQIKLEREKILRTIKSKILTTNDTSVVLTRAEGFETWLTDKRMPESAWHYWSRYRDHLEELGRPDATIRDTETSTLDIIDMLGDPLVSSIGFRKGLVVGEVQSGKTANFNGVINRAIDSGYKLIIVFSGILDDLRIQTQDRIEKDVIGEGTKMNDPDEKKIIKGVGELISFGSTGETYQIESITSLKSDFNRILRDSTSKLSNPKVLVCKKNHSVISHLIYWIQTNIQEGGSQLDYPLLVLDDEADNASLNNLGHKGKEYASKINALMRILLRQFKRRSYLGYTATPFANILQDQNESPDSKWTIKYKVGGEVKSIEFDMEPSLFPDDFIYRLKSASNYIGPKKIFEHGREDSEEIKLNIIPPYITDTDDIFPIKQKGAPLPEELPLSLKDAIDCFILAIGVRLYREPILNNTPYFHPHFTMLVHVSLYTAWQNKVADLTEEYISKLSEKLRTDKIKNDPDGIYAHFEKQWNRFFRGRIENFDGKHPELRFEGVAPVNYISDILPLLPRSIENIEVRAVNSDRKQDLKYTLNSQGEGKKYIAIGGNRLSRGFTLEGLTTNYFLRNTNYYDALLQMGRWFGYRPGYADVCRLFIDQETKERFDYVTRTVVHLEEQLDVMINSVPRKSPKNFQLRIRNDHDTLKITRSAIMKNAEERYFSFSSDLVEAYSMKVQKEKVIETWKAVSSIILSNATKIDVSDLNDRFIEYMTDAEGMLELLQSVSTTEITDSYNPQEISDYVREAARRNKLTRWRIGINMGNRREGKLIPLKSNNKLLDKLHFSLRNGPTFKEDDDRGNRLYDELVKNRKFFAGGKSTRVLSASQDESLGLGDPKRKAIEEDFKKNNPNVKTVNGAAYRIKRDENEGLMLLYFLDINAALRGAETLKQEFKDVSESTPLVGLALSFPAFNDDGFGGVFAMNKTSAEEIDMGDEEQTLPEQDEIIEV